MRPKADIHFGSGQHCDSHAVPSPLSFCNTIWAAATRAAFSINSVGITSKDSPPNSIIRHSESPHTEQHELVDDCALSHSSMGLSAIQMRLDWVGSSWKENLSISLVSRVGSIPKGCNDCFNFAKASSRLASVPPHRGHVSPVGSTSLCHTIARDFTCSS